MTTRLWRLLLALLLAPCAQAGYGDASTLFAGPNLSAARYGYDYKEDIGRVADSGSDAIVFHGQSDNYAYLANDLDGHRIVETAFRIFAQQDTYSAGFWVAYSFVDTNVDGGKGNGKTTGAFAEAVRIKFRESGNAWDAEIVEVTNGVAVSRNTARIPQNANTYQTYYAFINTNQGIIQLKDEATGPVLLEAHLDPSHKGRDVHSQWFIGVGHSCDACTADTVLRSVAPSGRVQAFRDDAATITQVELLPFEPMPGESVTVRVHVEDDWDHIEGASLAYSFNGAAQATIQLTQDSSLVYSGTIPGSSNGTRVDLRIVVDDGSRQTIKNLSYTTGSGEPPQERDSSIIPTGGGAPDDEKRGKGFLFAGIILLSAVGIALVLHAWGKKLNSRRLKAGAGLAVGVGVVGAIGYAFEAQTGVFSGLPDTAIVVAAAIAAGLVALRLMGSRRRTSALPAIALVLLIPAAAGSHGTSVDAAWLSPGGAVGGQAVARFTWTSTNALDCVAGTGAWSIHDPNGTLAASGSFDPCKSGQVDHTLTLTASGTWNASITTNQPLPGADDSDTAVFTAEPEPAQPTRPGVPGVQVAALAAGSLRVSWLPPHDGGSPILGYEVHHGAAIHNATGLSYDHAGLPSGHRQCYAVRAFNAVGAGNLSAASCARTPMVPRQVAGNRTAWSNEATTAHLAWTPPESDLPILHYLIRTGDRVEHSNVTEHTATNLSAATTHCFTIAAVSAAGQGIPSRDLCIRTRLLDPAGGGAPQWESPGEAAASAIAIAVGGALAWGGLRVLGRRQLGAAFLIAGAAGAATTLLLGWL